MSSESNDPPSATKDLSLSKDSPPTPKASLNHQKPNQTVMPGWMEFVLLAIGIIGFVVAMILFH